MNNGFVHLHVHSEYSVLDGAIKVPELVKAVADMGMPAVALTDHGNLFGIVEFYKEAEKVGIKPIIGLEAYVAPKSIKEKGKTQDSYHLTLLAKNEIGLKNLMYLSTMSYLHGFHYKPRIDKEMLAEHAEGLIALSGCPKGEIPRALLQNDYELAVRLASVYRDIFGKDNFFLELQEHGLEENRIVNSGLIKISEELGIPVVATNDVHFLRFEDWRFHDVLLCIQTKSKLNDSNRMRFNTKEVYLKTPQQMFELFKHIPEALINTMKIKDMIDLKLELDPTRVHLPKFELPEGYESEDEYIRHLAFEGLRKKMGGDIPSNYRERLEHELKVIADMNYSGYFLIIWDIVSHAKEMGIVVGPGRGSAVGSLVLYALGITEVDPIQNGLIFERFLNPERVSPPDVDIDFEDIQRDKVIEYIRKRFGENSVAQIITFGRMLARAAVRDVARVLDIPYSEADRIAKLIPRTGYTIKEAVEEIGELRFFAENNPKIRELLKMAQKIEGQIKHISTHAAGVVIAPGTIWEYVPLYKSTDGTISTQFEMTSLEELGLLKVDVLGLRTLTVVKLTEEMIRRRHDPNFDIREIPLDDAKTFELLGKGDTIAVFQVESRGFRELLRAVKPQSLAELTAIIALYRPGPIQSGMLEDYVSRKQGRKPVEYPLPELEDILKETYGVVVYQEQVMQIASRVAGFTLGQADLLRRAMGKKKKDVMAQQKQVFIDGAVKRGISADVASELFDKLEKFAGYGFNKSHAAAYALLSYRTAYLKAHYPIEFLTANLTAEIGSNDWTNKILQLTREAKRMGIKILPPDINRSEFGFTIQGDAIVYGLGAIKNVGSGAVEAIVAEREKGGEFKSFIDFLSRVSSNKVNRKTVESLIKAGAFDSLNPNRAALLEILKKHGTRKSSAPAMSMFGFDSTSDKAAVNGVNVKWDIETKMMFEKEAFSFYFSTHPLERYESILKTIKFTPSSALPYMVDESGGELKTLLVGAVSSIKRKRDRQNRPFAQVIFTDFDGEFQVTVFADLFQRVASQLQPDKVFAIVSRVTVDEAFEEFGSSSTIPQSAIRINAEQIVPLDEIRSIVHAVRIHTKADQIIGNGDIDELIVTLLRSRGDARLSFIIEDSEKPLILRSKTVRIDPSAELISKLVDKFKFDVELLVRI